MIAIVNMGGSGDDDQDPGGQRTYEVRINATVITTFEHKRSDGLAICLDKAAKAVRAEDEESFVNIILGNPS